MKSIRGIWLIAVSMIAGCGQRDTLDPTIDSASIGQIQVALVKSPQVEDYVPIRIVATKNEPESWLVTFVKSNDVKKRATFRISKKSQKIERVDD